MKQPMIEFHILKIDAVSSSSGIFAGRNILYDWRHVHKANYGFGLADHQVLRNNTHIVMDHDIWDVDQPLGEDRRN